MSRRASIIFIVLSGLASLLLLGLLVNQGQILSDLLTQQQEAEARVSLETAAVQAVLKDLTIEIDSLRVQLNDLSSRNVPADGSVSRTKQFLALNQLQSGLHILEQEGPSVGKSRIAGSEFTIYHFKIAAGQFNFKKDFHLGLAVPGFSIPPSIPRIYFDYDNDGRVDVDMMRKYIASLAAMIPFGTLALSWVEPNLAQEVYDRFSSNTVATKFLSINQINEEGNLYAQGAWAFIKTYSEDIAIWTSSAVQSD